MAGGRNVAGSVWLQDGRFREAGCSSVCSSVSFRSGREHGLSLVIVLAARSPWQPRLFALSVSGLSD